MKYVIAIVLALILVGGGAFYFLNSNKADYQAKEEDTNQPVPVEQNEGIGDGAEPLPEVVEETRPSQEVIGKSVDGNDINAFHYGEGDIEILFVGGIHGGYSYNTSLVAYELVDYLEENEKDLPDNVTVTVIPVMNPDGLAEVTGKPGRFNGSTVTASDNDRVEARFNSADVDLNRNFDCEWKENSTWRSQTVSGGDSALSEPEAKAVADYIDENDVTAAVVWFAAEGKVYPSACGGNPSKASTELANAYGQAAGYGVEAEFDAYAINGDMVNWFAKKGIAAISVLLTDYRSSEWNKNQKGIDAVIDYYANN